MVVRGPNSHEALTTEAWVTGRSMIVIPRVVGHRLTVDVFRVQRPRMVSAIGVHRGSASFSPC